MYKILFVLLAICHGTVIGQELSGKIVDAETGQGIPGAKVYISSVQFGVRTNANGEFSITHSLPNYFQVVITAEFFETEVIETERGVTLNIQLSSSHIDMEDVIVSSPGFGATRQESVFKVDRLKLNDLNAIQSSNLSEAISNINGVQAASIGVGISKPVVRGMQGLRVLTLINGIRIDNQQYSGDHGMAVTQLGISSVEVIKGASSLLYGSDAFGGVVYLVDQPYVEQGECKVGVQTRFESVTMGTSNNLNIGLAQNGFKINLSGMYSSNADYQLPNGKYLENSRFREYGGKLALGYSKKNWVTHLRYMYSNTRAGIPGHSHDSIIDPVSFQKDKQARSTTIPAQIMENHIVSLENKFFLGQHLLSLILANTTNRLTEFEDKVTIPYLDLGLNNTILNFSYTRHLSSRVKWINGFQSVYQNNRNRPKVEDSLIPNYNQVDIALYSVLKAKLGTYDVQAGLRADNRVLNVYKVGITRNFFSPNFALGAVKNWKGNTIRLNTSSGYRAPHVAEMLSDGQHHGSLQYERGNLDLNPEYSVQIDFSYELQREHLSVIVNPFYNYLLNYISLMPRDSIIDGLPYYEYDQQSEGRLYGVDIGVHYHPHFAHFLHLESSYSYIRAEGRDGVNFSTIPQARINSFLKFKFDMKEVLKIKDVVLQHQYFFDQNFVAPLEERSPAYNLINVGINGSVGKNEQVLFGAGVKNVLNTEYINHLSRLRNIDTPHPGRNFYVSIKYQLITKNHRL